MSNKNHLRHVSPIKAVMASTWIWGIVELELKPSKSKSWNRTFKSVHVHNALHVVRYIQVASLRSISARNKERCRLHLHTTKAMKIVHYHWRTIIVESEGNLWFKSVKSRKRIVCCPSIRLENIVWISSTQFKVRFYRLFNCLWL